MAVCDELEARLATTLQLLRKAVYMKPYQRDTDIFMPVSKNRRKKNKRRLRELKVFNNKGFVVFEHPFSALPREEVIKGFIEVGKVSQDQLPEKLVEAEEIIRSIDPLHTISTLSYYGLFGNVDDKGNMSEGYKGDGFNQSHVELAQALCLRIPLKIQLPASPDVIQKLFDILPDLAEAFRLRRFVELENERSRDGKAIILVQEGLRLHTQTVRNWGFFSRVIDITKRLCQPINSHFESKLGLSATQLIDLFDHLVRRKETLINARLDKLRPVLSERTVLGMIAACCEANSDFKDSRGDFTRVALEGEMTLSQIKSLILSHADLSLPDVCTFTAEELASEIGLGPTLIASALNQLSMRFGDTAAQYVEYLFLDNPVWTKPIIKLDDGHYFCALPQTFFSFIFQILDDIIKDDISARSVYAKRRADFLETETTAVFKKAFPACEIAAGYRWRDGTTEYENDLLAKIDSHLLVVETKSHTISWPALRGAEKRVKRHVEEVLLKPSVQSLRLANRVVAANDVDKREVLLPLFPFALDEIRTVHRLSATLEDFATLQSILHTARKAGWIPADHAVAHCVLLADLEIVFDILELTAHKIHYLERRTDLEAHLSYKGDELDLLGYTTPMDYEKVLNKVSGIS